MTPDQEQIALTLAVILTAAGAVIGAGIVSVFVQFLKSFPGNPIAGRERLAAFVTSAVLVGVAYISVTLAAAPPASVSFFGLVGAVLAFFNVARLSMAMYDDATAAPNSLRGPVV